MQQTQQQAPVFIHRVVDDGGLMEGKRVRRVHALTTDGRTFQHRRSFEPDTSRLSAFIADVEVRVENTGYRLDCLNLDHWEDVTDDVFARAGLTPRQ